MSAQRRQRRLIPILLVIASIAAGCGGGSESGSALPTVASGIEEPGTARERPGPVNEGVRCEDGGPAPQRTEGAGETIARAPAAAPNGLDRPQPAAAPSTTAAKATDAAENAGSSRFAGAASAQEENDPPAAKEEAPAEPAEQPILRIIAGDENGRPVVGAHVSSEHGAWRSGPRGFVSPTQPSDRYHVVAAGYWPVRDIAPSQGTISLRSLEVRAVYLPYEQLWNPSALAWALDLARDRVINAIVVDTKEEGGAVLPLVATEAVLEIEATVDPGADMAAFLNELAALGVYRIARQAVFLDTRLGRSDVSTAILAQDGTQLIDNLGLGWTTPFSAKARRYNIEIALNAVPYFEEIQFDYIRFPAGPLRVHEETTGEERSAAVAQFAQEAVAALHAAGAAMSIDTFGETAVIRKEDSIGQVLEDLIPHIDYYSPMLYPSTWGAGFFGIEYPPAEPGLVIELSMRAAVERLRDSGIVGVQIRPWLQDYRDYQPRQLRYGFAEVMAQIRASTAEGGVGFMLWNPTLLYHTDVLAVLRDEAAVRVESGAGEG